MKTMTEQELDLCLESIVDLKGAELRQFRYNDKALQIQWSLQESLYWLTFSMTPGVPYLFLSQERIPLVKTLKKPLSLFIKTHFLGRHLSRVFRDHQAGRVLCLEMEGEVSLRFTLIPGRVNIEAQVGDKSVYAKKPQPLPEQKEGGAAPESREPRPMVFFVEQWKGLGTSSKEEGGEKDLKKALKKKKAGLEKMQVHLQELKNAPWQNLGEWLKENQSMENIPEDWASRVDPDQSLSWNIENCFAQAKKNQSKVQGTEERLQELKEEISRLESGEIANKSSVSKPSLLQAAKVKGRTLPLADGRFFVGKSGKENLQLLRKAKPWYLWLHIKDYPGAYGIIELNKGQKISSESLQKAALAVVQQSLPKGAAGHFEVIYAECRYVRPIKGAKAGQVTYSHEKVLPIKVTG